MAKRIVLRYTSINGRVVAAIVHDPVKTIEAGLSPFIRDIEITAEEADRGVAFCTTRYPTNFA